MNFRRFYCISDLVIAVERVIVVVFVVVVVFFVMPKSSKKRKERSQSVPRVHPKSSDSRQKSKYWVFTLNNPTIEDHPPNIWPDVQYVIWQVELGEEKTEHLQGYVCFVLKKHLTTVKNQCSERAHWERRKGTHLQAKEYCQKSATRVMGPWEHGTDTEIPRSQGQRTELILMKRDIDAGVNEKALASKEEYFPTWAKYWKSFERYRLLVMKPRSWWTHTTVYWGPQGTHKSTRVLHEAGPDAYWLRRPNSGGNGWWNGYDGQETVVIDEFYGWLPRNEMLSICNFLPHMVETKGGQMQFVAKRVFITSNDPPSKWWPNVGLGAMERRLSGDLGRVTHMDEADTWFADYLLVQSASFGPKIRAEAAMTAFDVASSAERHLLDDLSEEELPSVGAVDASGVMRENGGARYYMGANPRFPAPNPDCFLCALGVAHVLCEFASQRYTPPVSPVRSFRSRRIHEYAMHGSPQEQFDSAESALAADGHEQAWLAHCHYCMAKVQCDGDICEECSYLMIKEFNEMPSP